MSALWTDAKRLISDRRFFHLFSLRKLSRFFLPEEVFFCACRVGPEDVNVLAVSRRSDLHPDSCCDLWLQAVIMRGRTMFGNGHSCPAHFSPTIRTLFAHSAAI